MLGKVIFSFSLCNGNQCLYNKSKKLSDLAGVFILNDETSTGAWRIGLKNTYLFLTSRKVNINAPEVAAFAGFCTFVLYFV